MILIVKIKDPVQLNFLTSKKKKIKKNKKNRREDINIFVSPP